ncbi:hypothetical protein N7533_009309 [Penicillium manginii]|uniref:uncharacterized protein n=1 Tax=Penicillium manginii TaxID=203109 RepID=UPI0025468B4B|nr:uncharacterized protein N7533_009309 [Penicillium manginii]KAJ5744439.1 hypothetical protein N7533_009309 [Penicillium manginii]
MAAAAMRDSPDMANGHSNHRNANGTNSDSGRRQSTAGPASMDYEDEPTYEPTAAERRYPRSAPKATAAARSSGQPGRSFSARARDYPASESNYTTRKSSLQTPPGLTEESTTPRGLPPAEYIQDTQQHEEPKLEAPPEPIKHCPFYKWVSQGLGFGPFALAEARKRMARKKVERENAEAKTQAAATAPQPSVKQNVPSESRAIPSPARKGDRKNIVLEEATANALKAGPRHVPGPRQNEVNSPQYQAARSSENSQYPQAEDAIPPSAKLGNVPRRSVTVSGPSGKNGPAGKPPARSQSLAQRGPAAPMQPADVILSEESLGTPPAARTAHDSVESHTKKRQTVSFNVPPPTPPPIFEWKNAPVAQLGSTDFDFQHMDMERSKACRALPKNYKTPAQKLTGVTESKNFEPKLFLRCGPLLRYTGIKKFKVDGAHGTVEKDIWRGSILIVTKDTRSSYDTPPSLRLFSQPMDLLPPPPAEVSGEELAPEYIDPTAGLMKVGRDGRPLYVKPVDHLEEGLDLSAVENDDGIYELSPSQTDDNPGGSKQPIPANRINSIDGETAGLHRDIPGVRLYADSARDVTFWRFNVEVELGSTQQRIAYRINRGPALGFWVPAAGQPMNIMFHSGNGFGPSVDSDRFCGPDPLWRDILNEHQTRPFHVMIGGGDQIFNDTVMTESAFFQEWIKIKNVAERYGAPFTPEFRAELEQFYLGRYAAWFSQGLFSLANSQIPMVNMWNDHEIFEGFGSYHEEFMQSAVISGLGKIAFKYYLLFQHHSVPDETEIEEPSWILGAQPGPYIEQRSRNLFMSLGSDVVLLGLDCRTERRSNEVLAEATCDLIWDRCHQEIVRGETKHLIVLSSVPIAYPRVAMLKNFMNSRKSIGKAGMIGGLVNRSGGNVEVYDDHWAGKHLKSERTWLVEDLQDLAAEKSVRVTILSGDVHLAAIGQFYSNPKLDIAKDHDYRYMPNIISSAIADMPETEIISDTLNKRNTVHHMDSNTDEDIIPIFTQDVNGKSRNNKRLLPRRNWCSIREYIPGSTPGSTPEPETPEEPEPRPGMLQRTLSLGRGDKGASGKPGILRRLSTKGPPPTRTLSFGRNQNVHARRSSVDSSVPRPMEGGNSYFPGTLPEPQPGVFHRRPTNLSEKAAKRAAKEGDDGAGAFVNLERGLAITLNMEVNPQDPSGITIPYKLLVPALQYEGDQDDPAPTQVKKGWRKWLNVPRRKKASRAQQEEEEEGSDEDADDIEDHDTINNTRANAAASHQYEGYAGSDEDSEGEVPQRLPAHALVDDSSPTEGEDDYSYSDEEPAPRKKKWFGVI